MRILLAPDKFKGSLSSFEVCEAIRAGLMQDDDRFEIISLPMADGGDGFAQVMQHYLKTDRVQCKTIDPLFRSITSYYQWDSKNKRAIIETASASGLVLLDEKERNPFLTSSRGTGIMIMDAIAKGAKEIILGLGGTATNDGGLGILDALGFRCMDSNDQILAPIGENLLKLSRIIPPGKLPEISFILATDVVNPLFGENGAAMIYAPQKGASVEMVKILDQGLRNLDSVIIRHTKKQIANTPGAGAAGGIAAALMAYFDVTIVKGIELIFKASQLKTILKTVDMVITGEGKMDAQSTEGKVVGSIAQISQHYSKPCYAICGTIDFITDELYPPGITKAFEIGDKSLSLEEKIKNAYVLVQERAKELFRGKM